MQEVPLFPLNTVLFRGGRLSLRIFEPRYVRMVTETLRDAKRFGVLCIRRGSEVQLEGVALQLATIGTLATIVDFDRLDDGMLGVTAHGLGRFRLVSHRTDPDGLLVGTVATLPEGARTQMPERMRPLAALAQVALQQVAESERRANLDLDDPDQLSCFLTELLPLSLADRQALLELDDPISRLDAIMAGLASVALPSA